jgi:hypothetical protein
VDRGGEVDGDGAGGKLARPLGAFRLLDGPCGRERETTRNHRLLSSTANHGDSWSDPVTPTAPSKSGRPYDPRGEGRVQSAFAGSDVGDYRSPVPLKALRVVAHGKPSRGSSPRLSFATRARNGRLIEAGRE